MGATGSTELPMSEVDYESYTGVRYSMEVPNTREGLRGPIVVTNPMLVPSDMLTLYDLFLAGCAMENGTRNLFGTRQVVDGVAGGYTWITYNEAFARVEAIAAGLVAFAGLQRQQPVGIFSKNRAEWCLAGHACDRMSYVLVPLYDTLGPDVVPYIVNHTELTSLFVARELWGVLLESKGTCPTLRYVVQFEEVTDEQRHQAEQKGLTIKSLAEIEAMGRSLPIAADPPTPDDISTLCYTSGTTGNPKGVVLLHKNYANQAYVTQQVLGLHKDTIHVSYLPLPHVFERHVMALVTSTGASAGFYQGDVLQLLDDIAALQPTIFVSVPRLLNRVYDKITQGVQAAGGLKKVMFEQAFAAKKAALHDGYKTHAFWDALVFAKVQQVLGGRIDTIISGSAPLSAEVKEFLQVVFACDVLEGYGMTETSAALSVALRHMPLGPHIGVPVPNSMIRLEDVPEMGYTSNDKPRPRGEILCKGPGVFIGYYKEPEKTAEALETDGWLHTGDIGCWNADGTLSVIDRKKNIFKLAQGEYVAAEKVEGVYGKSKYVAQIFVYGDSFQSCLVGVMVPDPEIAEAWGVSHGRSGADCTTTKLVEDPEFMKDVLADMTRVGKEAKLRGFEFVKKLHLHPDPFSVDEGLITPTFKLKRPQLKARFQAELDALYASTK